MIGPCGFGIIWEPKSKVGARIVRGPRGQFDIMVGPFGFGIKPEPVSKVGAAGKSRGIILCLGLAASVLFGSRRVKLGLVLFGGHGAV